MSSPARSRRSSRASTPPADTLGMLSPRSRIRALMAPFDEDSDDDMPVTKPTDRIHRAGAQSAEVDTSTQENPTGLQNIRVASSDDEEEEDVRPRGRLAARMAGIQLANREASSSASEEEDAAQVYQRIRKEMLAEKTGNRQEREATPQISINSLRDSPAAASTRAESPGLFVSPPASRTGVIVQETNDNSDSDSDTLPPIGSSRLRELVERRRRDRLAREAEEQEAAEKRGGAAPLSDLFNDEGQYDVVEEHRMTQQSRPTRKASKKALEEMSRETQRMSRNMQLTHQAKVKKRFTTKEFLDRFQSKRSSALANVVNAADSSSVVAQSSDGEDPATKALHDTPPSSPPSEHDGHEKEQQNLAANESDDEEMPSSDSLLTQSAPAPTHKSAQPPLSRREQKQPARHAKARQYRIVPPTTQHPTASLDDSDDDLEIVKSRLAMFDEVPAKTAAESHSLLILRKLAHAGMPEPTRLKKGQKPSMTPAQLEAELRRRAKLQAEQEKAEKIANLKARGILVQTEEERERDQMAIEDMIDRARREAAELRKREMAESRAAGDEDAMLLSSDDSDFEPDAEVEDEADGEEEGEEDVELSGSEEEDAEDEVEEDESENVTNHDGGLIDDAAAAAAEGSEDETGDLPVEHAAGDVDDDEATASRPYRHRRKHRIIDDDDDEEEAVPSIAQQANPSASTMVDDDDDDLAAAFGFGSASAAPHLNVSQMFAGTMADSQTQKLEDANMAGTEQDSFAMLRQLPSAPMPTFAPTLDTQEESQDVMVLDSQTPSLHRKNTELSEGQLQLHIETQAETPVTGRMSQFSEIPDPSQDGGFRPDYTPLAQKAQPHSTAETIMLPLVPESPVVQARKGRLLRRAEAVRDDDDESVVAASVASVYQAQQQVVPTDAFEALKRAQGAAKRRAEREEFDRKRSKAAEMVQEQAEESEDEYAGLGGASDDESDAEADAADKAMIDESDVHVDERALAKLYAERSRVADEAQTSKLYKDLMSGAMRRKRTGAFDLDSDEDEQFAERRRRKQREETRKRRLLLQDERLGGLAKGNDAKKEAFLRAIEDREEDMDSDAELDLLDTAAPVDEDDTGSAPGSQQQPDVSTAHDNSDRARLHPVSHNTVLGKRKSTDSVLASAAATDDLPRKRLPAALRRNAAFVKPASIAEIRESLSFLIEEPSANDELSLPIDLSDDESEGEAGPANEGAYSRLERQEREEMAVATAALNAEDDDGTHGATPAEAEPNSATQPQAEQYSRAPGPLRRSRPKAPVVDRLTLKKQSSSSLSATTTNTPGSTTAAAFAPSDPTAPGPPTRAFSSFSSFAKPPSLLRRATTNSSTSSSSSSSRTSNTGVSIRRDDMPPPARPPHLTSSTSAGSAGGVGGGSSGSSVRRGGSAKSSINYQAREAERQGIVKRAEARRKEKLVKTAGLRRGESVLGRVLGGGGGGGGAGAMGAGGFE